MFLFHRIHEMYQLNEIKLLEAHESEVLCLEYSAVDNGKWSECPVIHEMYLSEIKLLEAVLCLEYSAVDSGKWSKSVP